MTESKSSGLNFKDFNVSQLHKFAVVPTKPASNLHGLIIWFCDSLSINLIIVFCIDCLLYEIIVCVCKDTKSVRFFHNITI